MNVRRLTLMSLAVACLAACATSNHPVQTATLGKTSSNAALLAALDAPGPLEVETITSADWVVNRSGLINLDHPTAKAAGLKDGPENISLFFHAIRHPKFGLFIIDTGAEKALRDAPGDAAIRGMVADAANIKAMKVRTALGDWLAKQPSPLKGVLLTHLHLDHVAGLRDVPNEVPVFAGPGETAHRSAMNLLVQATMNRALEGKGALNEWNFERDASGPFDAVIDVFGDGSLFALWVPGHTHGSTAYLARTVNGPVLFVGDASHTAWGWEHDVEPGTFSEDASQSAESFHKLRRFAAEHPDMVVRLGHQAL